jgi:hypothetical protein
MYKYSIVLLRFIAMLLAFDCCDYDVRNESSIQDAYKIGSICSHKRA